MGQCVLNSCNLHSSFGSGFDCPFLCRVCEISKFTNREGFKQRTEHIIVSYSRAFFRAGLSISLYTYKHPVLHFECVAIHHIYIVRVNPSTEVKKNLQCF